MSSSIISSTEEISLKIFEKSELVGDDEAEPEGEVKCIINLELLCSHKRPLEFCYRATTCLDHKWIRFFCTGSM